MRYRLKEDANLTVIQENISMIGYSWPFKAGTEFDLIYRDKVGGHVILGHSEKRVFIPLPRFEQIFELVWRGEPKVLTGKWKIKDES